MAISKIKVGMPLDSPGRSSRGGMRWATASPRPRKSMPLSSKRMVKVAATSESQGMEAAMQAAPEMTNAPLPVISVRRFLFLMVGAVAVLVLIFGMVSHSHQAVAHSYDLSDLAQRKMSLEDINQQLKAELAQAGSLKQLELAARNNLGLITPQGQIVVID